MMSEVFFEVSTPLGFTVRCSQACWEFIVSQKHPVLADMKERSKRFWKLRNRCDAAGRTRMSFFLFYKGSAPRWLCAVARREDGSGFLITAYPTDAVKAGEIVWTRSR